MNRRIIIAAPILMIASSAFCQINRDNSNGYFIRGKMMFDDRNYAGSYDQLKKAVELDPTSPLAEDANFKIAISALRQGRADAVDLLNKFLQDYPASPLRLYATIAIADYHYDKGNYMEALTLYRTVDADALNDEVAEEFLYHKAFCLLQDSRYEEAGRIYGWLMEVPRLSNDATFYRGYALYADGKYPEALSLFKKVKPAKEGPTSMTDYYLAQLYYRDRDYNRAFTSASRMIDHKDVDPEYLTEAIRIAGESAYYLDNTGRAIELLTEYRGMTDKPELTSLYILGVNEFRAGDYQAAINDLTPVTSLDNAVAQDAYLLIGQSYAKEANYNSAMLAFENAYRMNFDRQISETALYNYAVARMHGGKLPFAGSVDTFKKFLRTYPDSKYAPEVREFLVTGYMTDNNYEAALESIDETRNPTPALLDARQVVLYTLGTRELSSGKVGVALKHFNEAKVMGSRNPEIMRECDLWIGECLYRQGNYAKAAESYQSYLRGGSKVANAPLARYDLGYALFGEKKFPQALNAFESFMKNPGNMSQQLKADALNRMGDCEYYASEFSKAAALYDRAYQTDPLTGDYALFQKAVMKGLRRDHKGKIDGLSEMMDRFPESALYPSALLETADAWQELENPQRVIEAYSTLVDRYPSTSQGRQGYLLLAITYLNTGNSEKASQTYRTVISNYPTSEEARVAADDLKRIAADNGTLSEYASFMRSVPNAPEIDPSEIEKIAFESAETAFVKKGATRGLENYLKEYPKGADAPRALLLLAKNSAKSGDYSKALELSSRVFNDFPHASAVEEALLVKAESENALDMSRDALATYTTLESRASGSSTVNAARLGIMRTSRDLGESEMTVEAADKLLASSTIGSNERDEVTFSRASALIQLDRADEAETALSALASDPMELYGAKSAYYLGQYYFDTKQPAKAREVIEKLVEANPPHIYWLARGFILLSDINREEGNNFEADEYLRSLRENYPGTEADIFTMIDQRLK